MINIMRRNRNIIVIAFVVLVLVFPVFSGQSKISSHVTGKIEVKDDSNTVRVVFEAREAAENRPAEGTLNLDVNGSEAEFEIRYVKVDGSYAWFAAKCTDSSSIRNGQWIFLLVNDGGTPGNLLDHIWWEWVGEGPSAEAVACEKVENIEKPAANKPVETGDIVVYDYE